MTKENQNVLDRRREVLLYLHAPEPPPTGPLETVAGRLGKGSFHEMLTDSEIFSRRGGSGTFPHPI